MTSIRLGAAISLAAAGLASIAPAITIHVPLEYPTIQAGIDAAVDGDTVLVSEGIYRGEGNRDIDFDGKAIVVISENGPYVTVIDCGGRRSDPHRGFYFHCGEDSTSVLRGFTIRNGYAVVEFRQAYGGGILCEGSSPTIAGNIITENRTWGGTPGFAGHGGGIYCSGSSAIITGNTITGNKTTHGSGGGIYCYESSPTIIDNTIAGNQTSHCLGGGICCDSSSPLIAYNTITENTTRGYGGGICCYYGSSPIVVGNIISGNAATYGIGGGISCWYWSSPTVVGNTISQNTANRGGGIHSGYSSPTVINSILWADSADTEPEILLTGGGSINVSYSNVQGGWPGEGNVDADPMFVLPEERDFRLLWGSPCIDSGHPDSLDPDGTRRDMGADFFDQEDYITLYLTPDTTAVSPGDSLGVTYTAINRWPQPETFWARTQVVLPGGTTVDLFGPVPCTLAANSIVQQHVSHGVPEFAPLGRCRYRSEIGVLPATLYDADSSLLTIDYPDYLIWEPDPTPISGRDIRYALDANGRTCEFVVGALGEYDLSNYDGLFVCLGIYPNNIMIMEGSPEAAQIETYIAAGGNVYMEGGDVWYHDPLVGGHDFGPSFGIDGLNDWGASLFNVSGVTNTLMPELGGQSSFYWGETSSIDELAAISPAEVVFTNTDAPDDIGVANPTAAEGYTIGISFELGGTNRGVFVVPIVGEFIALFEEW